MLLTLTTRVAFAVPPVSSVNARSSVTRALPLSAIFLRSPGVRGWLRLDRPHSSLLGPLRDAPLRAVLGANLLYAVAFGLYEMAVIAHTAAVAPKMFADFGDFGIVDLDFIVDLIGRARRFARSERQRRHAGHEKRSRAPPIQSPAHRAIV